MALSLGSTCIKYLLFIFNFIFVITGIILISVGAVIQSTYYDYRHFLDDGFFSIPALLIAVGTIIFIVSFFGCCGAFKENYCMTVTFCVFLILIFVLELIAGISGYVLRDRAAEMLQVNLNETLREADVNTTTRVLWDDMQTNLHCCGVKTATDWLKTNRTQFLPNSCCPNDHGAVDTCLPTAAYNKGCLDMLGEVVISNAAVLGGVATAIAIVQLLGIILACNLGSSIRKDYETV